ncbi:MAG TPA: TlpA disulfide reductase family protein [Pyrinomonadaceae bacterium]|nr:TlpA disulfide reductase family protein [Pyrinomonadaceae bacterium]
MSESKKVLKDVRFWTPLRLAATVLVIGLLAAFGASSCNSNDPAPTNPTVTVSKGRPGAPAPNRTNPAGLSSLPRLVLDAENKAARGAPFKLADYSGKVLLVNLWATWCGPCRMETPELVKLHKEFQSRGVEMIGLSTEDPVASAESVIEFVREYDVDYQIGWATREVAQTLMQGHTSIPQSFIIARDGRIVKRFIGFNPEKTPPQLKQALEEALSEKAAL